MEQPIKPVVEEVQVTLPHEIPQTPKRGRGRPSGSVHMKSKQVNAGKRGRPRKEASPPSSVKSLDQDQTLKVDKESTPGTPRKQGRPPKINKDPVPIKTSGIVRKRGRPSKVNKDLGLLPGSGSESKQGLPSNSIRKRGRPRKTPLSPEGEEKRRKMKSKPKGPRVWKPLGRPRIYPRVEPPVPSSPAEPKGRGRPRKTKSNKGAHFCKTRQLCSADEPPALPVSNLSRKRGRPSNSSKEEVLSSTKPERKAEQDMGSPPGSKRSRRSSGKESKQEPPPSPSLNKRERRDRKTEVTKTFEAGGSLSAVSQHRSPTRSQHIISSTDTTVSDRKEDDDKGSPMLVNERTSAPCQTVKKTTQGDSVVEERVGKKRDAGRKVAMPKRAKVTKGSRIVKSDQEKTPRGRQAQKNISSIL
ncbi:serine/arginine repetitive matrix protein 1 [Brienomyrus brachyistius]|uniref:serine/arginine repetitive matrix protein 1 n=1 Tax=Brienomyrus brachyistius TaxID=42636 RepID=UPI0020B1B289|nr:serine/arginine repetitive matrix protein 1 [Brienomyrus brachyistius]XP_048880291.1 serine/arginine repetitive matrix protein 1 [Brienomyrus brachyistius]XP_048880292.1 serine/arginine repetitive matrix protein 1 [Brienomyrus brachyistius]